QGLEKAIADLGVCLQEGLEVPLRDARQGAVGVCGDGRAAPLMVEESHLPERVSGPELSGPALDCLHTDRAVLDDHEADPAFTPEHDLVSGGVPNDLDLLLDGTDLRLGNALEKLGVLQLGHGQILTPGAPGGLQAFFCTSSKASS